METESIDVLLKEKRLFKPSKEFVEQSNVKKWMDEHKIKSYEQLLKKSQDQEWFWGEMAKETVEWYSPPKKILEWKPPYAQWFVGAKYNIVHDALDKHQKTKTRDKIAYIFEGEPGDIRKITYRELYEEVNKLANALRELGIKKGDRVGIYLPMIPELPISMLACAKIGAIHIVVFSGFSSKALEDRLTESEAKLLITCDGTWRRGKPIELKKNSDEGVANVKTIEHVIVYKRIGEQLTISWKQGRDLWWHDITNKQNPECKTEKMDANDVLFLLYTSGCCHPNTHIQLANGEIKTISDIIKDEDKKVVNIDINKLEVGEDDLTGRYAYDWPFDLYKIKTAFGDGSFTPNHKFFVLDSYGEVIEKEACNITTDDHILTCSKIDIKGSKQKLSNLKFKYGRKGYPNPANLPIIPPFLTPEFSQILGYISGDGGIDKYGVRLTDKDKQILLVYKKLIEEEFKVRSQIKTYTRQRLIINSKSFVHYIHSNFYCTVCNSYDRSIPAIVEKSEKDCIAAFIRGLFDAEGTVVGAVRITSTSKSLIQKLQLLLLRFGINSNRWEEKRKTRFGKKIYHTNVQTLTISNWDSISLFERYIGFGSKEKSNKLRKLVQSGRNKKRASMVNFLPISNLLGLLRKTIKLDKKGSHAVFLDSYLYSGRRVRKDSIKRIITYVSMKIRELETFNLKKRKDVSKLASILNISWEELAKLSGKSKDTIHQYLYSNKKSISKKAIGNLCSLLQPNLERKKEDALSSLKTIISRLEFLTNLENIQFQEVKKIERVKNETGFVCDLTALKNSNYIANGFLVHNTTGKPKGTIHAHGGYAVGVATTLKWIFDIQEEDIWWCAADVGWITGHSYIVYAPLMLGTTSIIYEGTPDYPKPDRWWEIIEKFKVSILYTSPTAVRMFMGLGEKWLESHNLSSLRLLGSVGEPINPEAWMWYYKFVGREKCPIMDTWWQTESGMQCISPLPISTLKPGSAVKPFPGLDAAVFDDKGKKVKEKGGHLVQTTPWPAMFRGVYKNPERYVKTYWSQFPNIYLSGDVGRIDKDGYFWVQGREDDVLKVAGHRLGNSEVESALVSHPSVAEAAVVGKPDQVKGEVIVAFVILKGGIQFSDALREELRGHVSKQIGPIAKPSEVWFVSALPKTRSGKIMRRVVRAKLMKEPVGDISTLMNPEAVEEIDKAK